MARLNPARMEQICAALRFSLGCTSERIFGSDADLEYRFDSSDGLPPNCGQNRNVSARHGDNEPPRSSSVDTAAANDGFVQDARIVALARTVRCYRCRSILVNRDRRAKTHSPARFRGSRWTRSMSGSKAPTPQDLNVPRFSLACRAYKGIPIASHIDTVSLSRARARVRSPGSSRIRSISAYQYRAMG